jgi:hypothetical protein
MEVSQKIWAKEIIVPIFKNGIKDDPAIYRGLTIGSNKNNQAIDQRKFKNYQANQHGLYYPIFPNIFWDHFLIMFLIAQ